MFLVRVFAGPWPWPTPTPPVPCPRRPCQESGRVEEASRLFVVQEHRREDKFSGEQTMLSRAGFQTFCIADFQVGSAAVRPAGLETRDTADLEVCATPNRCQPDAAASLPERKMQSVLHVEPKVLRSL